MLSRNVLTWSAHTEANRNLLFSFLSLSASVVSVEEMDRQQPTSPEEKKVKRSPSHPVTLSPDKCDSQRFCRTLRSALQTVPQPGWRLVPQSEGTRPRQSMS